MKKKQSTKQRLTGDPFIFAAIGAGVVAALTAVGVGLRKSFKDMAKSAKAQHEVDKANLAAVKAESRAQWEEAKAMGKSEAREEIIQAQRDEQIAEANRRKEEAEARINAAQK